MPLCPFQNFLFPQLFSFLYKGSHFSRGIMMFDIVSSSFTFANYMVSRNSFSGFSGRQHFAKWKKSLRFAEALFPHGLIPTWLSVISIIFIWSITRTRNILIKSQTFTGKQKSAGLCFPKSVPCGKRTTAPASRRSSSIVWRYIWIPKKSRKCFIRYCSVHYPQYLYII